MDKHDHTNNQSQFSSVPCTAPSSTSSTSPPGQWVRLVPSAKIGKWNNSVFSNLPLYHWTDEGAQMLVNVRSFHRQ